MRNLSVPIIETKNLTYNYLLSSNFKNTAIKNINVKIYPEDIVAIIGCTGSGKSSFIQHLNGLLKPSYGKVFFNGEDIWSNNFNIKNLRFKVGVVFQYPEHQLFEDTISKDIAFGPKNMGLCKEEIRKRVEVAANFVGLNKKILNESPFDVSGGEKRKAAIAGIIAMDPDVIVLDEPTTGLDPLSRDMLLFDIFNYHKKRRNTVIFTSHNMEEVAQIANKVLVLHHGNAIMFGKTIDIFSKANKLTEIGLSIPEITNVIMELKSIGYKSLPDCVLTVNEATKSILNLFNLLNLKQ
ncbi:MAG: energy-coupling factor transporter ATPase [Oscillospiraceae bacterium]|nr:energy-coupling factor transporter ATPase [Oscillospiraceae bacterium]